MLVVANYSEERIRMALARMIIVDELPFKFVDRQDFQEFMEIVEPRFPIPNCTTIARACMKIYLSEVDILRRAFVGQWVCLTTDTWTSIQNLNYMVVTAHFIDSNWTYQKKILNFCLIGNHRGDRDTIGRVVGSCLLKWGIDQLFTITTNNASSNDMAIDYVKKKTKKRDNSVLGGEFMHMRCYAHILNLMVQSGLKSIHESIVKVQDAMRYVKASLRTFEKF